MDEWKRFNDSEINRICFADLDKCTKQFNEFQRRYTIQKSIVKLNIKKEIKSFWLDTCKITNKLK